MRTFTSPFIQHRGYTFCENNIAWTDEGNRMVTHESSKGEYVIIKCKRVYFSDLLNIIDGGRYEVEQDAV